MYPGFGLLSTRVMKKEPLSYTFVEPDKRVVKSLQRCAQAGEVRVSVILQLLILTFFQLVISVRIVPI